MVPASSSNPYKKLATSLRFVHFVYFVVPIFKESAVGFFYRKGAKGRKAPVDEIVMVNLIF